MKKCWNQVSPKTFENILENTLQMQLKNIFSFGRIIEALSLQLKTFFRIFLGFITDRQL